MKEDFAKMVQQANLNERYIILFGKSVGLRASDFLEFTYGDFRAVNLDSEPPISLGSRKTKKEHVPAFPFIDSDSVPIIKAILQSHPKTEAKDKKGKPIIDKQTKKVKILNNDSDKVLDWDEESLTQSLQRLFERAHLESGGKTVRFHNYLFDKLCCAMSTEKAKQIVGKKISEGAYLTTESLRECYVRAMPSIIVNNGNGQNHVKIENLENALIEAEKKISALETTNEVLRNRLEDTSKTMQKVLDLPTIKREFLKQKEKVEVT
jgi:hypothetical protein